MARRRREETLAAERTADEPMIDFNDVGADEDDSLVLLFMCCHPALSMPSAIHPARCGRADHRGDRQRLSGSRGDDGAADQPRQAVDQGVADPVHDA